MHKKRIVIEILATLAICFVISLLFLSGFLGNLQTRLSDNLYGGKIPLNNLVIVAIDDKSLQQIGRWPWDRDVFVNAIKRLEESKVVGIDVGFFEDYDTEIDHELAEVIKESGNVVLSVEYTSFRKEEGRIIGDNVLVPVDELKNSADLGYVNVITDGDGITRAFNPNVIGEYKSFSEVIQDKFWGKETELSDRVLINYAGEPGSFEMISFSDLNEMKKDDFKNNIVLIGATSMDLHDDFYVPTSKGKRMPGVEVHANALQTLITKQFIATESDWMVVLSIFLAGILIFAIFKMFNLAVSVVSCAILILAYFLTGIWIFEVNILLNLVYVPLSLALVLPMNITVSYLMEAKEKKKVLGAFGKYVSPVVIKEILKHPDRLKLGGVKKELTVFFSDIRGFTSISERLTPEQLVHLLNEYLTEMTNVILKNNGVVDKYIGDAIMAFWGAPLDEPEHAKVACVTCLEMKDRLKEFNKKLTKEGIPEINIGIGLNSGEAVVGNMGSFDRFDYTAMGDTINLGARAESINKQYGTMIIITEFTKDKVGDEFTVRELDYVAVKGKKKPVKIYELIGKKEEVDKEELKKIEEYEKGLALYRKKQWDKAAKIFEKLKDKASKLMIERCKEFKKSQPPKEWSGAYEMKTK